MVSQEGNRLQLLNVLADNSDESEYRFLVDGKQVKYLTVDPDVIPNGERTFQPLIIKHLPPFPSGNWNEGHVSRDPVTGDAAFTRTTHSKLPGIKNVWHPIVIDHLGLQKVNHIRQNIHLVTHPQFRRPVIYKYAEFPWQLPFFEAETTAYQWIQGQNIGPDFLGHISEDGRVIGFIVEHIDSSRPAELRDLPLCLAVLTKLHSLDIKHGDINRFNFLMREKEAVMIDFETAAKSSEADFMLEEQQLKESLNSPSWKGGVGPRVISERMPVE